MKNKYINYFLASALLCVATTKMATAQWAEGNCGHVEATHALELAHPELLKVRADYDKELANAVKMKKKSPSTFPSQVYIIPIVFHIIHVNGAENISDLQVQQQVAKMNQDWRKLNADTNTIVPAFVDLACDVHIEFRLAQIDPNGNCTNGIDRIYSHKTFNADESCKLNQWPRDKYLNVWVVNSIGATPGVAGYALYPSAVATFGYPEDGVVMLYSVCNGTSRVLSHEIAHCFSLEHTFGDTNNPGVTCADDLVDDTPITKGHPSTCDETPVCSMAALSAVYNFSSVTPTSGVTDTAHITSNMYLKHGQFVANGVSANSSASGQFAFTNWDLGGAVLDTTSSFDAEPHVGPSSYPLLTGALNTSKYYEVTIDTVKGTSLTLTSLTFSFQRNATGVRTFAVRSSLDGYAANLPASTSGDSLVKIETGNVFFVRYDTTDNLVGMKITFSSAFQNLEKPVTFRIYGWNAEDAAGSFGIDNFTMIGSGGIVENTQNYMEYATCPVMFTLGQRDRMIAALNSTVAQRNNLWINSNLIATGTDTAAHPICVPHPDFYANRYSVCPGGTVTFTKNILYGTPAGNPKWTFTGGTPSTSTSANPV
ncbi:MAG: M43 family zinc metalloprotease, partial [Bacteroidia bacterium]